MMMLLVGDAVLVADPFPFFFGIILDLNFIKIAAFQEKMELFDYSFVGFSLLVFFSLLPASFIDQLLTAIDN